MKVTVMYRNMENGQKWQTINVNAETVDAAADYVARRYDVIGSENIIAAPFDETTEYNQNRDDVETVDACETADYIERPHVGTNVKLNKRALVWYWRQQSAYDLAEMLTGPGKVTEDDATTAARILDSVQRWALKNERYITDDNDERRYSKAWHIRDGERLSASYKRLNERLYPYGVKLELPGIYPVVVSMDGARDYYLLHWFE